MGYILCIAALVMNEIKGWCGKKTSGIVESFQGTILFCTIRMLLCIPIGAAILLCRPEFSGFRAEKTTIAIAAAAGISTAVFVSGWLVAVRNGAYMMVDIFLTLGVSVPLAGCRIVYHEPLTWKHMIGVLLLFFAAYVMSSYNTAIGKSKLTFRSLSVLILCGLANGTGSFCQKIFNYESADSAYIYNFYTYVFSFFALAAVFLMIFIGNGARTGGGAKKQDLFRLTVYLALMSLAMFLNSLFITMAAKLLPAAELYPLTQGGILLLSMIMSSVFFHERINGRCVTGGLMAFAALILINL